MRALAAGLVTLSACAAICHAATCPGGGASLQAILQPPAGAQPSTAVVSGALTTPSCDDDGHLATAYAQMMTCQADAPDGCVATFDGLRPGAWTQRIQVTDGEAIGQLQGRAQLLLDHTAGVSTLAWPLYRSVHSVVSLEDGLSCAGCLRAAIAAAEAGAKPALIQFAPELTGTIPLLAALPPLLAGRVTIDGFDTNGTAGTRTIDGNGLSVAALHVSAEHYQIFGLRLVNVGGDSDVLLIDGPDAIDALIDSVEVVGRAVQVCGTDASGCMVNGVCLEPTKHVPLGFCGDDGIAVRDGAGASGPIVISGAVVSGAFDKGIKVSDGGVAVVEDSVVVGNSDGGLQSTLGGQLTARRNIAFANRGTTSANGLSANGAAAGSSIPGQLITQGNLSIDNALRGISVRSLSLASLHDDFLCGNALGLAVMDAGGFSASATASGLAVVHNSTSGIVVTDGSFASLGTADAPGGNAVAFNGPLTTAMPVNFQNLSTLPINAVGDAWQHCGPLATCDIGAVQTFDIFTASLHGPVTITKALPTRPRWTPRISAIDPPLAAAGALVRIYGTGFDAIGGVGASCGSITTVNTCHPLRGNCVFVDRTPAEVVAVTPTMLVVRAPFTCVAPVPVHVRTRLGRGFATAQFCVVPPDTAAQ